MMAADPRTRFIDLMVWMHERNLFPSRVDHRDQYLCPATGHIVSAPEAKTHPGVLWIPTLRGLRALGLKLQSDVVGSVMTVRGRHFEGFGRSESEAILSYFNQMRTLSAS